VSSRRLQITALIGLLGLVSGVALVSCGERADDGGRAVSAEPPIADPTRPPGVARTAAATGEPVDVALVLQSVIVSPERRVAVINGRSVRTGDRVGDSEVMEISRSRVRLEGPKGSITLALVADFKRAPGERP